MCLCVVEAIAVFTFCSMQAAVVLSRLREGDATHTHYNTVEIVFMSTCSLCFSSGAGQSPHADPIALFSEATSLAAGATETGNVSIENTLGLNTAISFDFDNSQGLEFSLLSPNGRTYDINSTECTLILSIRIINCNFPGLSEVTYGQFINHIQI